MRNRKSTKEVIEEFVNAIAVHYLESKDDLDFEEPVTSADEFVSSIEVDLRSTLRSRISQLETVKRVEQTPTAELSESEVLAGDSEAHQQQASPSHYEQVSSVGSEQHGDLTNHLPETLDPSQQSTGSFDVDATAELKTGANDVEAHASPAQDSVAVKRGIVSSSSEPHSARSSDADLSYDNQTMAPGSGGSKSVSVKGKHQRHSRRSDAPDVPDDYEIISTLGKGGMGVVYKALHKPLNRTVAIKMIIAGANASDELLSRFQLEAEAAAHLSHPNIVSVFEVGNHNGLPFFSLEFVEGQSLSQLMREQTLSPKDAAELLIPIARAVHYSHDMGIIHRDLKPQNVLLTEEGEPKVADFGLAKRLDDHDSEMTRTGVILGTPGYMAPEQARSTKVGPQTDIYALGSILYYMMTGRPPFTAPTPIETVRQLLHQDPVWPSRLQADLDKDLETICLKALEKDVDKRYQTAEEFADELQRFRDGRPIVARPITRREQLWKWCKRNPKVATLSGLAAGLLLCILVGGYASALVINKSKNAEAIARDSAEANAEVSRENARIMLYGMKTFFKDKPELESLRAEVMNHFIERIEDSYEKQKELRQSDQIYLASADRHLGELYVELGEYEKSIEKLTSAERQLTALEAEGRVGNASITRMLINLALGDAYFGMGDFEQALAHYKMLEEQRDAHIPTETDRDVPKKSLIYGKLAKTYEYLGKPELSRKYVLQAVEMHEAAYAENPNSNIVIDELAGALNQLSVSYQNTGELELMLDASRRSLALQEQIAEEDNNSARMNNVAKSQKDLAQQYLLIDKQSESLSLLETAAETAEQLTDLAKDDARFKSLSVSIHYWRGITEDRMGKDASESFAIAEKHQRELVEKADLPKPRGTLMKILARAGKTDEAVKIADNFGASPEQFINCGYAAVGYALASQQAEEPEKSELKAKAIDFTRKLIRKGYHNFEGMRSTDMDFEPLWDNAEYQKMLDEEEARVKEQAKKKADS